MPACETKYFGSLEYQPGSAVEFASGLPGFETRRRFLLIEDQARRPVVFLQSLEDPHLCFLTVPVAAVDPAYQLKIPAEHLRALGLENCPSPLSGRALISLAIVSVEPDGTSTANLLAPVLIRRDNGRAVQAVRDDAVYSCRHKLLGPSGAKPCW